MIRCLAALLVSAASASGQDLSSLRQEIAPPDSPLRADDNEFRQAVNGVAEREAWGAEVPHAQFFPQQQQRPAPASWAVPPADPAEFNRGTAYGFVPGRSSEKLLLTQAFALERIAHELEMAGQFQPSETVRRAAGALRKEARKAREATPTGAFPGGLVPANAGL